MVWVQIIIAIVMAIVGELLRPKQKINDPKPSAIGDFQMPTVDASRVISVFWGTCKHMGPNCTWFGDLTIVTLKKKVKTGWFSSQRIVTGYNYYLGVQLVFSYGPIDEFIQIRGDDKIIPTTGYSDSGDVISFTMNAPTLLSKDDPPSGVKGPVKLYKGSSTQSPNAYLSTQWSEPDMSAFRPLFYAVLEKCYLGNTDQPPPISVIARRCPNPLGLAGGMHNINGDANIACALYELMTNRMWGMKIPADKIDMESFIECGITTATEGLGISMLIQNAMSGKDLMAEILRHADGVVYADPVTGLYTMVLAREDYDIDELLTVDSSNIVPETFEFSRVSWEMTKNTIIVQYTDRETFDVKPVQYQDLANINVRGGMIDSEELSFLGLSNPQAALNVAARACKVRASPLVRAQFSINRIGYQMRPGTVFKLSKPDRGIGQLIMRVIEINYGTIDDPTIKIVAMEDIFAINGLAYNTPTPTDWTPPLGDATPLFAQRLEEAPEFNAPSDRVYVITLGTRNGANEIGYDVWTDPVGGTDYLQTNAVDAFTPSGTLTMELLASDDEVDDPGFIVSGVIDAALIEPGPDSDRENGQNLLLVDDEWMAWRGLTNNGDGTYTVTGVFRGALDTVPTDHDAGARVWFMSEGAGVTDEEGYSSDVDLTAKLLPRNPLSILPIGDATELSITTVSRAKRPLPPGKFRVNGLRPAAPVAGQFTVAWAHRTRLDTNVIAQNAASRTQETGVLYNLRAYDHVGNSLLAEATEFDAASAEVTLAFTGDVRIELESTLDGLLSYTRQVGIFAYDGSGSPGSEILPDTTTVIFVGGGA